MMNPELKENIQGSRCSFGYFGSKHKLALSITKYIPPHNAWVDAFCGSAAVTLAKSPASIEIINDINGEIVNFFYQLRENKKKLCELITLTPYAREELINARLHETNLSSLERARRFVISSMMAINGVFGDEKGGFSFSNSYVRSGMEARVSRWYNLPDRISKIVERLRNIRIENKDARKLIKDFINRPATLLYLDPPYLGKRSQGYDYDQNDEKFHKELLELACRAKCMVMISSYENELYNNLLKASLGWERVEITTHTQGSRGKRNIRTEILWLNKYIVRARLTKAVPIALTEKEVKLGKINPVR